MKAYLTLLLTTFLFSVQAQEFSFDLHLSGEEAAYPILQKPVSHNLDDPITAHILAQIEDGSLMAYDLAGLALKPERIRDKLTSIDTIISFDKNTYEEKEMVVVNKVNPEHLFLKLDCTLSMGDSDLQGEVNSVRLCSAEYPDGILMLKVTPIDRKTTKQYTYMQDCYLSDWNPKKSNKIKTIIAQGLQTNEDLYIVNELTSRVDTVSTFDENTGEESIEVVRSEHDPDQFRPFAKLLIHYAGRDEFSLEIIHFGMYASLMSDDGMALPVKLFYADKRN